MTTETESFYITGGTLRPDAPCYVERQADRDLLSGLLNAEFCYVLTSRQMGKSSLMVRTAGKLRESGANIVVLDLTAVGQNLTPEQWYDGLLMRLGQQLELEDEVEENWARSGRFGPCQRFFAALRDVVLPARPGPLVVFVDEIDSVRSLPFSTDEFFAAIRECYNRRVAEPEFQRLTFCLLGVATPSDLIRDTRTTPFNIGRRVELNDFTESEAAPLAEGMRHVVAAEPPRTPLFSGGEANSGLRRAKRLLGRILYWTGGHPYLTQRFCRTVAERSGSLDPAGVDRLCEDLFFSNRAQERDDNLLFVRERLLRGEANVPSLLELYLKVRRGKRVPDDDTSPLITVLRLSGIVKSASGRLTERNHIYFRVFDAKWVRAHLPDADVRRQKAAFQRGVIRTGAIAAVVVAALSIAVVVAVNEANKARRALERAALSDVRAGRVGRFADQRSESLRALKEVSRYSTNRAVLRDEAIACMALLDLKEATDAMTRLEAAQGEEVSGDLNVSASADPDGAITIRRLRDGHVLKTLPGSGVPVERLRFGPKEPVLVAEYRSSAGTETAAWDWTAAKKIFSTPSGLSGNALDMSSDGRMLALGLTNGSIVVHAWPGGELIQKLQQTLDSGGARAPQAVRFQPSGNLLAVSSLDDHYVELWRIGSTQRVARPYHSGEVYDISWHPQGQSFAAACADTKLHLWHTNNLSKARILAGHEGRVLAVAYNHRGTMLASVSDDETVRLWVPATERHLQRGVAGHSFDRLRFTANDRLLVAVSRVRAQSLAWDVLGEEYVALHRQTDAGDKLRTIDISPDSKWLLAASGKQVTLWQTDTGREFGTMPLDNAAAVWFSADGRHLIASSDKGLHELPLSNLNRGNPLPTDSDDAHRLHPKLEFLGTMALSPDRAIAAVVRMDKVDLVPLASGSSLTPRTVTLGMNYSHIALHPTAAWLATAESSNNELHLWSLSEATDNPIPFVMPYSERFAFSPDGKWLATCSGGKYWFHRVGDWTKEAFPILRKLASDQHAPVAFSRDGRMVAVASSRDLVQLFRMPDHDQSEPELIATLESPDRFPLEMLVFSPDGRRLAAATDRRVIQLWNLALLREGLAQLDLDQGWPVPP